MKKDDLIMPKLSNGIVNFSKISPFKILKTDNDYTFDSVKAANTSKDLKYTTKNSFI